MSIINLHTPSQNYLFDPEKEESILRVSGKFASVYKGVRESDNMPVVIKKLNPVFKRNKDALDRFRIEASLDIDHPNIARPIDFVGQEGEFYLVREYVEGLDILSYMNNRKFREKEKTGFILRCAVEILNGLAKLHKKKIYHCDIRPANIIVQYNGPGYEVDIEFPVIKLIDLGLAKIENVRPQRRAPFSLIYSPPEQLLGYFELLNTTTDIYSLGISLYELITGERPFYHDNPAVLMNLQLTQQLEPDKKIPSHVFSILNKATQKHLFSLPPGRYKKSEIINMLMDGQKKRYTTAEEMKGEIIGL